MNMHIISATAIGLILITVWYYQTSHAVHTPPPVIGLKELVFTDASRMFADKPRTVEVALWHPVAQNAAPQKVEFGIWKIKDAARNATICAGKKFPLIIFSHGYSGNQWVNTWFAEYLAEHGYMVVVVRHYGNSYRNMIPELSARLWNRHQDMSFVLDQLLQDPELATCIDADRIGAAGFSQGGIGCLWLAGARAELTPEILKRQITIVNNPAVRMMHFKDIPDERLQRVLDDFTQEDFDQANCSHRDERFKAAYVIAPGIDEENLMFTTHGLNQVAIPVHITIGAADTDLLEQANFFATHIPRCSFTLIDGQVTHMTLLNEGTPHGKLSKPAYTMDHPSVDRGAVHKAVASEALQFFDTHLR